MGLITYTNLEDDTTADANKFNERFGAIVDEVNGNIDTQNLKNSAVTREKIASGAVTSDKLSITKTIDANGWTVTDYGTTKDWTYRKSGSLSINSNTWVRVEVPLPEGITNINDVFLALAPYSDWTEIIFTIVPAAGTDKIYMNVYNAHKTANSGSFNYRIDFTLKRNA